MIGILDRQLEGLEFEFVCSWSDMGTYVARASCCLWSILSDSQCRHSQQRKSQAAVSVCGCGCAVIAGNPHFSGWIN